MKNKIFIFAGIVLGILLIALIAASALFLLKDGPFPDQFATVSGQEKPRTAPAVVKKKTKPAQTLKDQPAMDKPSEDTPLLPPEPPSDETPPGRMLTDEQRAETEREIARMKEELPGNQWIPEPPSVEFDKERGDRLRKSIQLTDKIKKGTATREEQIEYYRLEIKSAQDKIDLMRYISQRTDELKEKNANRYLTSQDTVIGEEKIMDLEGKISDYKQKLSELGSAPGDENDSL